MRFACVIAGLQLLAGCAGFSDAVSRIDSAVALAELRDTPFYPQTRYQCGPAALATILEAGGVRIEIAELVDQVYVPARQGSLQVELIAATRRAGRVPYRVDGTLGALAGELAAGRPVLVLQNLGVAWYSRWHYAVLIGIDAHKDVVILRSGTDRRRETERMTFLRTWRRSQFWGFVALEPGTLPASPDRDRYLRAVADFEVVGSAADSLAAWQAAIGAWPDAGVAWFGLGNALLARGQFSDAEAAFRRAAADPSLWAARNNLAFALANQGRVDEALAVLHAALDEVTNGAARAELRDSLRQISGRR